MAFFTIDWREQRRLLSIVTERIWQNTLDIIGHEQTRLYFETVGTLPAHVRRHSHGGLLESARSERLRSATDVSTTKHQSGKWRNFWSWIAMGRFVRVEENENKIQSKKKIIIICVSGDYYKYSKATQEIRAKAKQWQDLCALYNIALPAVAMAFANRPEVVSSLVIGVSNKEEAQQNLEMLQQVELVPDELWNQARLDYYFLSIFIFLTIFLKKICRMIGLLPQHILI